MGGVPNEFSVDLLVIGAGPAGSAAALSAARHGLDVLLVDAARLPRDKTCGDGLTPRALHALKELGIAEGVLGTYRNRGLKLHGFGGSVTSPWPRSGFGQEGSARPRVLLDAAITAAALRAGARVWQATRVSDVEIDAGRIARATLHRTECYAQLTAAELEADAGAADAVAAANRRARAGDLVATEVQVRPRHVLVADGVRSEVGRMLGRRWHRDEVFGIAARSYCTSPYSREPWIHSHVELRDAAGAVQPGYGWVFPLGDGSVNLGCGALSTDRRPAKVNTKKLLRLYAGQQTPEWRLGEPEQVTSALLPMGGAVSGVAGANWMLIGDAACLVNPLNGEGIDYAIESARLAVELITAGERDIERAWPETLRRHYGDAFALARTLARALTHPRFLPLVGPIGLSGPQARVLMPAAARLMSNLVTEADRDLVARLWRLAGSGVRRARRSRPLWG